MMANKQSVPARASQRNPARRLAKNDITPNCTILSLWKRDDLIFFLPRAGIDIQQQIMLEAQTERR